MKVLVTGGAGYIGSHTVQKLLKQGHEVCVYDNLTRGFREAVPEKQVRLVMGDVRDAFLLQRVMKDFQPEAVIHFAAKLVVPESLEQPVEYYENNTYGVMNLIKACQQQKVDKIVFSSTAAVYGDANTTGLVKEEDATTPLNPYGASKLFSERILKDAEFAHGIRTVVLRYFNVAGGAVDGSNGQRTERATQLVKVAAEVVVGIRPHLELFGTDYPTPDGTCVRDYIHVEDLADLHILGLEHLQLGRAGTVLNCGYGHGFSVSEVVAAMKRVSGVDFKVVIKGRRPGDAAQTVADISKLKGTLAWKPKHDDLELICRTALEWEKKMLNQKSHS